VLLSLLLLTTCSNAFNIFDAIKTEMKIANDLFLEILLPSVSPSPTSTDPVSQLERIEIQFDRSINEATIDQTSIVFDPPPDPLDVSGTVMKKWTPIYYDDTHTLHIYPDPVLNASSSGPAVRYTVTVNKNLKGTDGSDLQEPYSWSFETKESPTGNFFIEALGDGDAQDENSEDTYAVSPTVQLYIYGENTQTTRMKYGETESAVISSWSGWEPINSWWPTSITLPAGTVEGEKTLFMGFADDSTTLPTSSMLKADTIILDLNVPTVNVGSNKVINYYSKTPVWLYASSSDGAGSGIKSYQWTKTSGPGTVTFGSATSEDTTVSIGTDGTYVLDLEVTDNVDRQNNDSLSVSWDTTRPAAPDWDTVKSTPTVTVDTQISWYWTPGGGGNGEFKYSFEGGAWTKGSSPFTYRASADGLYTLRVTELDDAGNNDQDPRLYADRTIRVTPVIPYNGASYRILFGGEIDFDWRDYGIILTTYAVYMKKTRDKVYTRIGSSLSASELPDVPVDVPADYVWYYTATTKGGTWTSPVFSFSTTTRF
jgi:hypothetical protein